jgi:hypothetical protein
MKYVTSGQKACWLVVGSIGQNEGGPASGMMPVDEQGRGLTASPISKNKTLAGGCA